MQLYLFSYLANCSYSPLSQTKELC